jgi:hypothetical protein
MSNSRVNLAITVGHPSHAQTCFEVKLVNSHTKTSIVNQEISAATGHNPNNNSVWVYSEGQSSEDLGSKLGELGFFGSPQTFNAGNGAWALIDLDALRETGAPIPAIGELPFANQPLPGESHIELKLTSGSDLNTGIELEKSEGFSPFYALFDSFTLGLNIQGDSSTIATGLDMVSPMIGHSNTISVKTLFGALNDADIKLGFTSFKDLNPDFKNSIKGGKLKIPQEVAGIVSAIGDLFEQNFRIVFVVNTSTHFEVKVSVPGLVNFAMTQMDE